MSIQLYGSPAFQLPSFQKDSNWRMKLQLNLLEREEDRLEVGLDPQAQGTSIPE